MKYKKIVLIICMMAAVTIGAAACSPSESGKSAGQTSQTAGSESGDSKKEIEQLTAEMEALGQKIEKIMDDNKEVWDKVYQAALDAADSSEDGSSDSSEENPSDIPADGSEKVMVEEGLSRAESSRSVFTQLLEQAKPVLTEEEIASVQSDIDKIYEIETEMEPMIERLSELGADEGAEGNENAPSIAKFPKFQTKDLDGNEVDDTIFSKNAVTLVNFWFNECSPCIDEMPALEELNNELKSKGGAIIGVNADGSNGEEGIKEAKRLLKAQGATYQNVYFDPSTEAGQYASQIQGYPTTLLIDREGNVVGEPITGSLNNEKSMKELNERIDEIIANDSKN